MVVSLFVIRPTQPARPRLLPLICANLPQGAMPPANPASPAAASLVEVVKLSAVWVFCANVLVSYFLCEMCLSFSGTVVLQ